MDYKNTSDGMMAVKSVREKSETEYPSVPQDWGSEQPHLMFDDEELPEIKDWKVGEEYTLQVQVHLHKMKDCDGTTIAKFEVCSVKSIQ